MGVLVWIAIILFVLWIVGFGVFHMAGFLIHALLVVAVAAFIVWLVGVTF